MLLTGHTDPVTGLSVTEITRAELKAPRRVGGSSYYERVMCKGLLAAPETPDDESATP